MSLKLQALLSLILMSNLLIAGYICLAIRLLLSGLVVSSPRSMRAENLIKLILDLMLLMALMLASRLFFSFD